MVLAVLVAVVRLMWQEQQILVAVVEVHLLEAQLVLMAVLAL
jgi:hypothetical protein